MAKTYVTMDYDTVVYAGNNRADACQRLRNAGWIDIWENGKYTGHIKPNFKGLEFYKFGCNVPSKIYKIPSE